jgi:hypothetical protein
VSTRIYGLLDSLYERVKGVWEERFERSCGFWRGLVDEVVASYLLCGVWQGGFARVQDEVVEPVVHAQWVFTIEYVRERLSPDLECWPVSPTTSPTRADTAPTSTPTTPTASADGRIRRSRATETIRTRRRGAARRPAGPGSWPRCFRWIRWSADAAEGRSRWWPTSPTRWTIRQILDHLDLSPPEKPPPDIRDVVRVPVDEEGREIEVQPA